MDLTSIIGIVGCAIVVVYGIVVGKDFTVLLNYWDIPSFCITVGGTLFCMMTMSGSLKDFSTSLKSVFLITKAPVAQEEEVIQEMIGLANMARKEGILQLEEASGGIGDEFLQKGVLLVVDGTDQELVLSILQTDLDGLDKRHQKVIGFWESMSNMGPAWGMIGTLIGLINMLKQLDDPSAIGPSMAVALITTMYGALIANWLAIPISKKLRTIHEREMLLKEMILEGLMSIQSGDNPRVIEEKLKSFLAPSDRTPLVQLERKQDGES